MFRILCFAIASVCGCAVHAIATQSFDCGMYFTEPFLRDLFTPSKHLFDRVQMIITCLVIFFQGFMAGMVTGLTISFLEVLVHTVLSKNYSIRTASNNKEHGMDHDSIWYPLPDTKLQIEASRAHILICDIKGACVDEVIHIVCFYRALYIVVEERS